jgi:hypothetical protein
MLLSSGKLFGLGALSISGTPVTSATQNTAYPGFTVSASGGALPYTYSLVGSWPTGISINSSTGAISGTPSVNGTFASLSVRVTDGLSHTADLPTFTLTVSPPASTARQGIVPGVYVNSNGPRQSVVPGVVINET